MQLTQLLFFFFIIIPSAIVHEYAHGWAADRLGDPTARLAGRLTLNPKAHVDPVGTILLPIILILLPGSFLFAYAKPVPFNPYNLMYKKWGPAIVAAAGPVSNIFIALIFGLFIRFIPLNFINENFLGLLGIVVYINILLAIFNLLPIPPLDGSKILLAILPDDKFYNFKQALQKNGLIILFFFLFFGFSLIMPIIQFLYNLILGI